MSRRNFDYSGHPCEPYNVTDNAWFYAEKIGLIVCQYKAGDNAEVAVIPWRLVKRALADHEKAKERKTA